MGYFSNLAAKSVPRIYDCSYTLPEKQLLMRLEELEARLGELTGQGKADACRAAFTDNDLRYILPEHLQSPSHVAAAIALAISDLAQRYGIRIREASPEEKPATDEITAMQISFLDMLLAQQKLPA